MDYFVVGLAGFVGAVARALLTKYITPGYTGAFPISTLTINLTGSFFLCFFMLLALERLRLNPKLRLAVGTGFCGAYTTFSTFSVESINLIRDGLVSSALAYIAITAFGCILCGWLGNRAGRLLILGVKKFSCN